MLKGSSPLTRGKPLARMARIEARGLIPAHAGKTLSPGFATFRAWAHPRSRGENGCVGVGGHWWGGSSPLTRGKHARHAGERHARGLIPAHAGKTNYARGIARVVVAHPRSRGENRPRGRITSTPSGSSPLTRGKRTWSPWTSFVAGLIPAHAGKTPARRSQPPHPGAHPRSRGENSHSGYTKAPTPGSSPLTRGKPACGRSRGLARRLIPAHAGKTRVREQISRKLRAHPRSRGENPAPRVYPEWDDGSSPLTRGKHTRRQVPRNDHRLIPAHAGKTIAVCSGCWASRAHPRSRGENT